MLAILLPTKAIAYDCFIDGISYNIDGNEATVTYFDTYYSSYSGDVVIPEMIFYDGINYPVTRIGAWAFYKSNLSSVIIPNTVSVIEGCAFYQCRGLESIELPNSVTSIEAAAFEDCNELYNIEIPNSVIFIGNNAFNGTAWFNNQPDGLVYAGLVAYQYKGIMPDDSNVELKEGTLGIAGSAFSGCSGLVSINIPNTVTNIGNGAFGGCTNLTTISIPNSVTHIGEGAFINTKWYNNQPDGLVYAGLVAYKYKGTMTQKTTVIIQDGTLGVASEAFANCDNLYNIEIPNSVSVIGESAFSGCTNLRSIDLPNSIDYISDNLFYGSGLNHMEIGESIKHIGNNAFSGCRSLDYIELTNTLVSIENNAFDYCPYLFNITIRGNGAWNLGSIPSHNLTNFYIDSHLSSIKGITIESSEVYCFATIPPICDEDSFTDFSGTLHVPAASLASYFTSPFWSNFTNIVGDAVEPKNFVISKDSVILDIGNSENLIAIVSPNNSSNNRIYWKSTNPEVATVDYGLVNSVGLGECDIIAYCYGMRAICHISVVFSITLDKQEATLLPNHILTLTPSTPQPLPNGVTVSSSDPTVAAARVMNGKVQVVGIKEGKATITVESPDGTALPATCLVTVYTEMGDVNMDGFVNVSDVTTLISYILGQDVDVFKLGNADLNDDGFYNVADVTALIAQILAAE